jgi:hypothetical protein
MFDCGRFKSLAIYVVIALTGQPRSERNQRYAIAAAAAIGGSKLNHCDGYKFRPHHQRLLK